MVMMKMNPYRKLVILYLPVQHQLVTPSQFVLGYRSKREGDEGYEKGIEAKWKDMSVHEGWARSGRVVVDDPLCLCFSFIPSTVCILLLTQILIALSLLRIFILFNCHVPVGRPPMEISKKTTGLESAMVVVA